MGQRLIITEEDRKNILYLYEVKNVPPHEKVLVAKGKNPYKDDDYKEARRIYNPGLVNNELFYEAPNFVFKDWVEYPASYFGDLSFISQELFIPIIVDKLYKKTIRDNTDDKIYTIDGLEYYSKNSEPFLKLKLSLSKVLVITPDSVSFIDPYKGKYNNPPQQLNSNQLKDYSNLIQLSRQLMNNMKEQIDFYQDPKNLSQVPDKYFNIYKIVRTVTDF